MVGRGRNNQPRDTIAQETGDRRPSRARTRGNWIDSPAKDGSIHLLSCETASYLPWMRPEATRRIVPSHQGGKGERSNACEFQTLSHSHSEKASLFRTLHPLLPQVHSTSRRMDASDKGSKRLMIEANYPSAPCGRRNIFLPFAVPVHR